MLAVLVRIIEAMTGRPVRVFDASQLETAPTASPPPEAPATAADGRGVGFGLEYDRRELFIETESTAFSATGIVRTVDGREIRFTLELRLDRSYRDETETSLRLGSARKKDPLVINFAGHAAQLSEQRFRLDLDGDGTSEEAQFPATGSGFLVFDRNGDGAVNNGRELFGPGSGDGFADLALLDDDRNNWIDEGDAAFADLRLWTKSAAGEDRLATLAEAGIGAVGLARIATPFDLKDGQNRSLAEIRSSGLYLREDGGAGTVQQIDLSV